jgi:hypothetical protein
MSRSVLRPGSLRLLLAPAAALLAVGLSAGPASAAVDVEKFDTISGGLNCNGDSVTAVGTLHRVTKTNKDGTQTVKGTFHGQGTSLFTGTDYVLNFKFDQTFDPAVGFTFDVRNHVISKGNEVNAITTIHSDPTATPPFSVETKCTG